MYTYISYASAVWVALCPTVAAVTCMLMYVTISAGDTSLQASFTADTVGLYLLEAPTYACHFMLDSHGKPRL